jgi:hypothetical protein
VRCIGQTFSGDGRGSVEPRRQQKTGQ